MSEKKAPTTIDERQEEIYRLEDKAKEIQDEYVAIETDVVSVQDRIAKPSSDADRLEAISRCVLELTTAMLKGHAERCDFAILGIASAVTMQYQIIEQLEAEPEDTTIDFADIGEDLAN